MDKAITQFADRLKVTPGVSKVQVDPLPSGIVYLRVWFAQRCFGLAYYPKHGFAVYDLEEQFFDSGPSENFDNLSAATNRLLQIVKGHPVPAALAG